MQARLLLVLAAVAAIGAVAWFALQPSGNAPPEDIDRTEITRQAAPEEASDDLAGVGSAGAGPARVAVQTEIVEASATFLEDDHPWAGQLAGVRGRLIEEDGTPVPSMRVELIEADLSLMFGTEHAALGHQEPEVAEAFTKDDGTFFLDGARDSGFHALNIDRGGGRATIRLVEQSLEHGNVTDLGDITMDAFGTIIGVVIDEDGEPVGGARVRAAVVPEIVMQTGVLDARPGVVVTGKEAEGQAFELPPVAFALLDRLPVPTTTTAGDGSFRLEGVPLGSVSGGADKVGHVAGTFGPLTLTPTEYDVGEIELLFGRNITGRVTDDLEEPVEGVDVVIGAYHPLFPVAMMQPAGSSDATGAYSTVGIPEDGQLVGAVRRHKSEPWQVVEGKLGSETIDFVLPAARRLTCRVVDEAGEPVQGAEVRVRPSYDDNDRMGMMTLVTMTGRMPMQQTTAKETEPGTYIVEDLLLGSWMVEARAPGRAIVRDQLTLTEEDNEIELLAPTGRTLRLVVTDEITGLPVSNAHATLLGPEGFMLTAFASAFTKKDGSAKLGPLSPSWHEDAKEDAVWLKDIVVSVEHPKYGMAKATVSEDATEIALALPPMCTVEGRVHWAGAAPQALYMIALRWNDDDDAFAQATMLPKSALTNLDGGFRITGLAPGSYDLYVMERYFEGNPIKIIVDRKEPKMIDERDVVLEPEAPAFVDIELSPDGQGPSGSFAGKVMIDGQPLVGAKVSVGRRDPEVLFTDSAGEFQSLQYSVLQRMRVQIEGDVPLPDGTNETRQIYREWKRPKADEVTRVDLDLAFRYLAVQVVDRDSGSSIGGAKVRIDDSSSPFRRNRDELESDSSGLVEILLSDKKDHTLVATQTGYARTTMTVSAKMADDGTPVRLELQPSIPCTGQVRFADGREVSGRMWMHVTAEGHDDAWTQVKSEDATFELKGLSPGDYKAEMWLGPGRDLVKASFMLPEGGSTTLILEFASEDEGEG